MQCPACHSRAPEDAKDCSYCGLIFSKWKGKPTEAPAEPVPAPVEKDLPVLSTPVPENATRVAGTTWIFGSILLLLVAGGVYLLTRPSPPPASVPAPRTAIERRLPNAWPTEPIEWTPTPGPTVVWRFEGKVYDILHQVPIAGVTVTGDTQPPSTVLTDASGFYSLPVTVSEGSTGVYLWLNHPDFGNNYWVGDHTQEPYEQRIRMYGTVQFQGSHQGRVDQSTPLSFSMFPQALTEEERTKIHDTLYPPARD